MDTEIRYDYYLVFRNPFRSIIILIMITAYHRACTFLTVSLHCDSFCWCIITCLFVVFCSFVLFVRLLFVCDAFCLRHVIPLKTDTIPYFELLKTDHTTQDLLGIVSTTAKKVMASTSHRSTAYSKETSLYYFKVTVICAVRWQVRNKRT